MVHRVANADIPVCIVNIGSNYEENPSCHQSTRSERKQPNNELKAMYFPIRCFSIETSSFQVRSNCIHNLNNTVSDLYHKKLVTDQR